MRYPRGLSIVMNRCMTVSRLLLVGENDSDPAGDGRPSVTLELVHYPASSLRQLSEPF